MAIPLLPRITIRPLRLSISKTSRPDTDGIAAKAKRSACSGNNRLSSRPAEAGACESSRPDQVTGALSSGR